MGSPSVTLTARSKPAYLTTGRPWSWYMASTASNCASSCGTNTVSAGSGPLRIDARGAHAARSRAR